MKKRDLFGAARVVFVGALLLSNALVSNLADQTVVPNQYTNEEGPGGLFAFDDNSRQVFVYSADLFSLMPPGGGYLEGVAFRFNTSTLNRTIDTTQELEVRIGITSKPPQSFPQTDEFGSPIPFSILEGRSAEVVFPRATIPVKSTIIANQLNPFNIHIPFAIPYRYDPVAAHLFIDVRTFDGASLFIDGTRTDGVVSLLGDINSYYERREGPVALFQFTPIPEPTPLLFSMGISLILLTARKMKSS